MRVSSIILANEVFSLECNPLQEEANYILTVCLQGCALVKFSRKQSSVVMEQKSAVLSTVEEPCQFINTSENCVLVSTYFSINSASVERMKDWFFFISYEFMIELNELFKNYKSSEQQELTCQRLKTRVEELLSRLNNVQLENVEVAC